MLNNRHANILEKAEVRPCHQILFIKLSFQDVSVHLKMVNAVLYLKRISNLQSNLLIESKRISLAEKETNVLLIKL